MPDGFARVPHAVLRSRHLNGYAKLVYALLEDHADRERCCYPSLTLLATESGWSRPTIKRAIDDLVAAGLVLRQHTRFYNRYHLTEVTSLTPYPPDGSNQLDSVPDTEVTSLTPCPTTESTELPPSPTRSKPGFPTESTTFTNGVNQVYTKENQLRRTTEGEDPASGTSSLILTPDDPEGSELCGERAAALAPPDALESFDAQLRALPGYAPTPRFYAKVLKYQALDLEEEAIKIAAWLKERPRRQCSVGFVLGWLKREGDPHGTDPGLAHASRHGGGAGRNGYIFGRQQTSGAEMRRQAIALGLIDPEPGRDDGPGAAQ